MDMLSILVKSYASLVASWHNTIICYLCSSLELWYVSIIDAQNKLTIYHCTYDRLI